LTVEHPASTEVRIETSSATRMLKVGWLPTFHPASYRVAA